MDSAWTPPQERFLLSLPSKVRWGYDKVTPYWGYKEEIILLAAYVAFPENKHNYLLLDIDEEGAGAFWLEESLPQPTFITVTPENGHALYGYELATPVTRRLKNGACWVSGNALEYYYAVRAAYQKRLCADAGYSEWNGKNPLSDHWASHTHWYDRQYTLDELAKHVILESSLERRQRKFKVNDITSPDARLFEAGRKWAYRHVKCYQNYADFAVGVFNFLDSYNRKVIPVDYGKSEPASNIHGKARKIAEFTWENRYRPWIADCAKERGKLGLGRICPNLTNRERLEEIRERQEAGALYTNVRRKAKTAEKITDTVAEIRARGEKVTVARVAREVGVPRSTIYRHQGLLKA